MLQDAGDEFFGFLGQTVFRRWLVQVEDDQAQAWFIGHEIVVTDFGITEDTERGIADQIVQRRFGEITHFFWLGADQFLTIHENSVEVGA